MKYPDIIDEPQMAREPLGAVAYNHEQTSHAMNVAYSANRGSVEDAITGAELKVRLHESRKSRF